MNELLLKNEVHQVVGCCMEVLNTIGHGMHEKVYENALAVELQSQGVPFRQQQEFQVLYKNVEVGKYIPDLICSNAIVVDLKTIEKIDQREIGQMLNYLRITQKEVGIIVNFKKPKLEWKRVVLVQSSSL